MIILNRSFPHPVLSPLNDDVTPNRFLLEVTVTSDADHFYVDAHFEYDNATLEDLVGRGLATHVVHVECKRNFYREIFVLESDSEPLMIPAAELVGRTEVCGFIMASAPLERYQVTGAHSDYGDATFQVQAGDVLAAAPTAVFDAYVDYDPLDRLSSILTIRRSDADRDGPMVLDTTGDRIVATLSQSDYKAYTNLKGDPNLVQLLANQVVVPALFQAIGEIKDTPADDRGQEMDKRWYRSVIRKLEDNGMSVGEMPVNDMVQVLLKWPLRRSLVGLLHLTAADDAE